MVPAVWGAAAGGPLPARCFYMRGSGMADRWMDMGNGIHVRSLPDGRLQTREHENVRRLLANNKESRRESCRRSARVGEVAGMPHIAKLSPTQAREMDQTCGNDPDKKMMWLRDHPEVRTEDKGAAQLPKKRITIYGKGPGK